MASSPDLAGPTMDVSHYLVGGRTLRGDDPSLQVVLSQAYDAPERPRCLCTATGVEMYVAHHRAFVLKRMPGTGPRHHPSCTSFDPDPAASGRSLLAGAVHDADDGDIELQLDFPWRRTTAGGKSATVNVDTGSAGAGTRRAAPRLSLHGLLHLLFERARLNRWSPGMDGRNNQGVLHLGLCEAARSMRSGSVALGERLYVPEPFQEATHAAAAQRRRQQLEVLRPVEGTWPLALVVGEFKQIEHDDRVSRVWIRHMPDAPLLLDPNSWSRLRRRYAAQFEVRDADSGLHARLIVAALIRARRQHTYEIDTACVMLTSRHWIPVEGLQDLELVEALVLARRRFLKPLRYDAQDGTRFADALLLDVGATPLPMHCFSAYMSSDERARKEEAVSREERVWVWPEDATCMPAFPPACR